MSTRLPENVEQDIVAGFVMTDMDDGFQRCKKLSKQYFNIAVKSTGKHMKKPLTQMILTKKKPFQVTTTLLTNLSKKMGLSMQTCLLQNVILKTIALCKYHRKLIPILKLPKAAFSFQTFPPRQQSCRTKKLCNYVQTCTRTKINQQRKPLS